MYSGCLLNVPREAAGMFMVVALNCRTDKRLNAGFDFGVGGAPCL